MHMSTIEKSQAENFFREDRRRIRCLTKNWTKIILDDLKYKFDGKLPRNFVVNIRGLIGSPSGVFKSALGLALSRELDPTFNVKERVAMSPADLNDKIKKYATIKQVFFLDEQPHDLKFGEQLKLYNTIESCRENQICFITCGIPKDWKSFSTVTLERFSETSDDLLPEKWVKYLVSTQDDLYDGYFVYEIPQLRNRDNSKSAWGVFWDQYMGLKRDWQERVKNGQASSTDFVGRANSFLEDKNLQDYMKELKNGGYSVNKGKVKLGLKLAFPDDTGETRAMMQEVIISKIEELLKERKN